MGNRDLQIKLFEYNYSEAQNLVEKRKVAKSDTEVGHEDALIGMELVSGHQQQCLVHSLQEVPVVGGGGGQYYSQNLYSIHQSQLSWLNFDQ